MALTNREKQARHRDRLRDRSSALHHVVAGARLRLREYRHTLTLIDEGALHLHRDRVDITDEHATMVHRWIAETIELLTEHDPEGLTADGNIELGDIAPARSQELWRGRAVSFVLDVDGRASALRAFDTDSAAQTAAAMIPGRLAGKIGDDGWSIVVVEEGNGGD